MNVYRFPYLDNAIFNHLKYNSSQAVSDTDWNP